jgi:hypothetical protein
MAYHNHFVLNSLGGNPKSAMPFPLWAIRTIENQKKACHREAPRGNFGHGEILDEESSQCFVATVKGQLRVEEEATARLTIHDTGSHQYECYLSASWSKLTSYSQPGKAACQATNPRFRVRIEGVRDHGVTRTIGFENAELRGNHMKNN